MEECKLNTKYKVLTDDGWKKFEGIRKLSKTNFIEIILENEKTLKCSYDHLLKTKIGWISAKKIKINHEVVCGDIFCKVKQVKKHKKSILLYDLIEVENKKYYTNNILSHNCSFIGSSNTLIDADKLNILSYGIPKTQNKDGLAIYEEPIKKNEETNTEDHVYFMAVDVARGQNKDYSAFVVIDITSMPYRVVAKFKNNLISPLLLPSYVFSVGKKYNNAYILVETNDVGSQVADILHSDLEYENLIKSNYKGSKGQIITEFKGTSSNLGVRTTLPVKKLGCSVLKNLIETDKLLTEDPDIVNELTTFIAQGKSFAAEEGHNDDLVMCLVLFSWASRQQFFENLTNNDVRVAMFKNEIIQIEQEIIPFFMQDGQDDSEFNDGKDFWQDYKKEKNSLSTQIWFF